MESVLAVSTRVCACTCAHTLLTQIKYKTQLLKTEQLAQNEIVVLPRAEWGEQEWGEATAPSQDSQRKQVGHTPSTCSPQLQKRAPIPELCCKGSCVSKPRAVAFYRLFLLVLSKENDGTRSFTSFTHLTNIYQPPPVCQAQTPALRIYC